MKKNSHFALLLCFSCFLIIPSQLKSQTIIALWNFENTEKRLVTDWNGSFYTADDGIALNKEISKIKLYGGAEFDTWATGSGGTGTFSPNTKTWNSGTDIKYWQIDFSTFGYTDILLSSKLRSSNTGPKNFKLQYSLDANIWNDINNSDIVVAANFTSGVLTDFALPVECNNQEVVYIRWLMSSEVSVNDATVSSTGTNRIDDIIVKGSGQEFTSAEINPLTLYYSFSNIEDISTQITWNDANNVSSIFRSDVFPSVLLNPGTDYFIAGNILTFTYGYISSIITEPDQFFTLEVAFDVGENSTITITSAEQTTTSAVINPNAFNLNLQNPDDFVSTITWNDASSVVSIQDNQSPVYTLQPNDFSVNGNTLTIQQTYLTSILQVPETSLVLTVNFNLGNSVNLTVTSFIPDPSEEVIALWNFENSDKRTAIIDQASFTSNPYTADLGNIQNTNISSISLIGGASFNSWTAGTGGAGTFAANAKDWNEGNQLKYWQITVNTTGYKNIKLSSTQRSSATGPKNFIVQYSLNGISWTDVSGSEVTCADNYTSGVLSQITLPESCNNTTNLKLRWIMSSNTSVAGQTISSAGTSRIDDIKLSGKLITDEAEILSYSFPQQTGPAIINNATNEIQIEIEYGADISNLTADFILSPNASAMVENAIQTSSLSANNFTLPVTYTVTSGNGLVQKNWIIYVSVAQPSNKAEFLSFSFPDVTVLQSNINDQTSEINLIISGTQTYIHPAVFTLSQFATAFINDVEQQSGVTINNFSQPVVYNVVAQDGSVRQWTIYVEISTIHVEDYISSIISAYPNPCENELFISLNDESTISLFSMKGACITTFSAQKGVQKIFLQELPSGAYILNIKSKSSVEKRTIIVR